MKIIYDARWTRTDTHDGISRYGASLLAELAKLHPVTTLIHDKRQLKLLPDVPYIIVNDPMSPAELFLARKLNKLGVDVAYSPLQVMGTWGRKYKQILTLHDMIYYHNAKPPTHIPPVVRGMWWLFHRAYWPQRALLNQADYVTTVSQTAQQEILDAKLTNRPIAVIYNAPPALQKPAKKSKVKKELVYMGSFMPYKNVELLLRAMPLLPEYKLHLASRISPARQAELEQMITNHEQVVFWNGASDGQYADLLSSATALVTASKDEGFGLPLIEAMSLDVPAICADIPIFHEVGGKAALFFDPDSPEAFAAQVRKIEDPLYRQALITAGREQASMFTWQKSAKKLLGIMRELTKK